MNALKKSVSFACLERKKLRHLLSQGGSEPHGPTVKGGLLAGDRRGCKRCVSGFFTCTHITIFWTWYLRSCDRNFRSGTNIQSELISLWWSKVKVCELLNTPQTCTPIMQTLLIVRSFCAAGLRTESRASMHHRPYLKRCSPPQALWLCWHSPKWEISVSVTTDVMSVDRRGWKLWLYWYAETVFDLANVSTWCFNLLGHTSGPNEQSASKLRIFYMCTAVYQWLQNKFWLPSLLREAKEPGLITHRGGA